MYVTRGLSLYRKDPSSLSIRPPDYAPNTGVLVITDDLTEEQDTYCWGACDYKRVKTLPFPQNKMLSIVHSSDIRDPTVTKVWFLPVVGEPLSAHRYYIIRAKGQHKGKACTSSKKSDICSCCCYSDFINDIKPRPFDYRDIYQQFEIRRYHGGGFYAKSVAYDGVPPRFLRKKGWEVRVYRSIRGKIHDALGLDESVQASLPPPPSYPLPPQNQHAAVIVGRWYSPFLFLREEAKLWRHMKKSMFYEITLEQYWEEIYSRPNRGNEEDDTIVIDAMVKREEVLVYGSEATIEVKPMLGFVCFTVPNSSGNGNKVRLGMGLAVFEAMRGIQMERGWMENQEDDVRVERVEEIGRRRRENMKWKRFGCYVLVESFLVRRIDGILIMKYNFKHTHKIQCKWD
ncbi:uncharacterized protein LOC110728152 [Chenopodium quinoa]|uniref:uncharacterized protein LOC110728152 n=1 Tax=Chenopodium quinoa TaxID=63459 RepID=UPI000B797733|nr:uncharacterized protein LOC110728152 [Chenopodium quinoa]